MVSLSAFGGVAVFVKENFQDGIRIFVKVEICWFVKYANPTSHIGCGVGLLAT